MAIVPVFAAVGLFFFVSNLGAEMAIPWLFGFAAMSVLAKLGFRDFGSLYQSDPETPGGIVSHRRSGNLMALVGVSVAGGGILTLTGQIGLVGAGVVLCAGLVGVVVAHFLWYREWQSAVGFSVEEA